MPLNLGQAMTLNQGIHVVAPKLRVQAPRQLDRAQHPGGESDTEPAELRFDEAVVKPGVVGHEHRVLKLRRQLIGHLGKQRRVRDHAISDAGKLFNKLGNPGFRIEQGLPLINHTPGPPEPDADFGDSIPGRISSGGLDIKEGKRRRLQMCTFGGHRTIVRLLCNRRCLYTNEIPP